MKKDTIIAIIAGFLLGLGVAFSFLKFPSLLQNGFKLPNISFQKASLPPAPSPKKIQTTALNILEPSDGQVMASNKASIIATAPVGATLVVATAKEDFVDTLSDGKFKTNITLDEGANVIEVTSYVSQNIFETKSLTVYYTKDSF